jgi:hypothetical protein
MPVAGMIWVHASFISKPFSTTNFHAIEIKKPFRISKGRDGEKPFGDKEKICRQLG